MKKFIRSFVTLSVASLALIAPTQVLAQEGSLEIFNQKIEMHAVLQEIVADFNEEYGSNAELVTVPDGGTVLRTRMANNDAPDVVNVYPQNADFKQWAADNRFLDITDEDFLNRLVEETAESYAIGDRVYNLPLTTNSWGFFYNVDLFEELGLDVPNTWADFEALVTQINELDHIPFAGAFSTQDSWTLNGYHQLAWVNAAGSPEEANEYLRFSESGSISAEDEITKKAAEQLTLLVDNAQPNANGASYADSIAAFVNGQGLILPNGLWALPVIMQQQPSFEVGTFAYPGQEENQALTVGAADLAFSISEDSDNKELALQFLEYMTREDVLIRYYDVDGMPTTVKALQEHFPFEQTKAVSELVNTDQHFIWLQSEWDSEEGFWHSIVDYINSGGDISVLETGLNQHFDPMKD
ncbi:extracellular solute-binding protein [Aerococcaceae bacterium DSM 109653]|uniref:Extracellular solute-binding protein n=1 Tax=Fundicoccus ignavus TaxID=2664442 RepID=A0A844C0J6_9LACT|nr:extracellular solute-binding protein [Fundicoccus ignavus]MRI82226.1 extracellular solute-binding protein [Fundicoccus ignavus]